MKKERSGIYLATRKILLSLAYLLMCTPTLRAGDITVDKICSANAFMRPKAGHNRVTPSRRLRW